MVKQQTSSTKFPRIRLDKKFFSKVIFVILTMVVIGFLGYRFKDKILAGVVNGEPIFRFQLSSRLDSQYGKQVLEDLIIEKLIYQEAKAKAVTVSPKELEEAVGTIKKQLGENVDFESLLASQGIKKTDFENQLKTQILLRKLLEKEVSVSEEEVANFIKENKKTMTATSEADLANEAKGKLLEQKIGEKLNSWVSELRDKAKILRFIR